MFKIFIPTHFLSVTHRPIIITFIGFKPNSYLMYKIRKNYKFNIIKSLCSTNLVIPCLILSCLTAIMADESANLVSASNSNFANKLYQILAKDEGNVFFSPISAHAVLSLAYQGAEGDTAKSFQDALGLQLAQPVADGYKNIMTSLNSVENVTLHIANKVFVQQEQQLKDTFKAVATNSFLSEAENVNFADNVVSAKKINDWVEDKTNNKIKDLIKADDLDSLTRLVLVNAIYFKGDWLNKFEPKFTKTEPFYTSETDSVDCQMMHITKHYDYADNDELDAQILRLPYKNTDVSLVIILPRSRTGIKALEAKLANTDLNSLTRQLRNVEVNLSLPKFKIETTIPLNEPLKKLGLGNIFSDAARFPNMIDSNEPLKVSKVIQKAFIEVNEEGAEAAAATGLIFLVGSSRYPPPKPTVIVDHPFIMLLNAVTETSQNVLFYGRVSNIV